VILDLLGQLGNNVFEVGFANRIAAKLGYGTFYTGLFGIRNLQSHDLNPVFPIPFKITTTSSGIIQRCWQ